MIVSVTCRHGTQTYTNRKSVEAELAALSLYNPEIVRAQAVFSKETHHHNAENLVTCHLSISIPKHHVNLYAFDATAMQAFGRAKERLINQISRKYPSKLVSLKRRSASDLVSAGE